VDKRCGCCEFLQVLPYTGGDSKSYWCGNRRSRDLVPPIGEVRGLDAPACQFFIPVGALEAHNGNGHSGNGDRQRFLASRESYYNVPTVAHLLGKASSTVYRYVTEGRIKAFRSGKTIYIHKDDIDLFLANGNGDQE
jgi:excisionase family DNA binding protein